MFLITQGFSLASLHIIHNEKQLFITKLAKIIYIILNEINATLSKQLHMAIIIHTIHKSPITTGPVQKRSYYRFTISRASQQVSESILEAYVFWLLSF